jgi:hypothetical protein
MAGWLSSGSVRPARRFRSGKPLIAFGRGCAEGGEGRYQLALNLKWLLTEAKRFDEALRFIDRVLENRRCEVCDLKGKSLFRAPRRSGEGVGGDRSGRGAGFPHGSSSRSKTSCTNPAGPENGDASNNVSPRDFIASPQLKSAKARGWDIQTREPERRRYRMETVSQRVTRSL